MAVSCKTQQSPIEILNSSALPHTCANQDTINHVLNIVFVTLGGFALLMLVIGGIRYVFAGGSPDNIKRARSMIIYSLVGLVMVALAAAIVNVVLGRLK